jgi:catechol 2,3-dioxygenase
MTRQTIGSHSLARPGLGDDADKIRRNGMRHCSFEFASFADLMSSYDRLRKAGVQPAFCVDHGLTFSIYYEDPEGNYVELQSDNFSDWKLSTEYMRTSRAFSENPIGVFFDPARVYESYKSGADLRTLQKTRNLGPESRVDVLWHELQRVAQPRRIEAILLHQLLKWLRMSSM